MNINNKSVFSSKALFIKLGSKGAWESECLLMEDCLKLGYENVPHDYCVRGDWKAVARHYLEKERVKKGVATFHTNQIRYFYEESESVLWFTFHNQCLWWCLSEPKIKAWPDGTRTRPVIGKWSSCDTNGNKLLLDNLSGALLKIQGFRGTICLSDQVEYLLNKINGHEPLDVRQTREATARLEQSVEVLVKKLQPKDFEVLTDLIFRQSGWQRLSVVGKTQKDIDLDLISPATGERAFVQVKSQSDEREFQEYQDRFSSMGSNSGYSHFFYVVHSPSKGLEERAKTSNNLFVSTRIAQMVVRTGLIEWLLKKVA